MRFEANFYDGKRSARQPCSIEVDPNGFFTLPDGVRWRWHEVRVSDRIGSSARYIDLPDGSRLETTDNDTIDQLCPLHGGPSGLIHRLESRLRYVLAAIVLTVVAGGWFVVSGIPLLADQVARQLPPDATQALGAETLTMIDTALFAPSRLPATEQQAIRALFAEAQQAGSGNFHYQLHFRDGLRVGANAFALPSGDIVITDQLVQLADHPDALAGVLAHEIAHVELRHITRRILQDSALPLIITAVTGDMTVATSVLAGLPTLLAEAHYSRAFETEADRFALDWLEQQGRSPVHLAALLKRMSGPDGMSGGWLSTHPGTDERIARLRSGAD